MNILLTGGLGYIGCHTAVALKEAGHEIFIYDNLSNSQIEVLDQLEKILSFKPVLIYGDIRNTDQLSLAITKFNIEAVIHLAGLKAVGESVEKPIEYYENNVSGTVSLIKAMQVNRIQTLVFSSSATVYGNPRYLPLDENHYTSAINPYGKTKLHIEQMLHDLSIADETWSIAILRYFNPVGAHHSGLIGECPSGTPNNLMPYIADVAAKERPYLNVWGGDYETNDGTGVRDYIHIMDLAAGHVRALEYLNNHPGLSTFNLGTGIGYSVLDVIKTFEEINQVSVPYYIKSRRDGDIASCYATCQKANQILNWTAERDLAQMCKDHWRYKVNQLKSNKKSASTITGS